MFLTSPYIDQAIAQNHAISEVFYCSFTFSGLQIGQRWKRWISRFHHGQFCLSDSCLY